MTGTTSLLGSFSIGLATSEVCGYVSPILCTWILLSSSPRTNCIAACEVFLTPALKGKRCCIPIAPQQSHGQAFSFWEKKKKKKSLLTERKQGDHQILLSGCVHWGLLNQLRTLLALSPEHLSQPTENYHTFHYPLSAFMLSFPSVCMHPLVWVCIWWQSTAPANIHIPRVPKLLAQTIIFQVPGLVPFLLLEQTSQ